METKADILSIEDDPFMRDLVALSLRDAGYRVSECTGQRAQHLHETVFAKVIVVDLNEPKTQFDEDHRRVACALSGAVNRPCGRKAVRLKRARRFSQGVAPLSNN